MRGRARLEGQPPGPLEIEVCWPVFCRGQEAPATVPLQAPRRPKTVWISGQSAPRYHVLPSLLPCSGKTRRGCVSQVQSDPDL